jgi:CheY-like chemotaxis protein
MATQAANSWIEPLGSGAKRVLVVDDDREIRELLVELLSTEGYEVSAVSDGRRALAEARARRPDVILLDLMMPIMNGWEFREAQLEDLQLASVPVVIVSAFDVTLDVAAVLRKPFQIEQVLSTVQRLTT